MSTISLPGQTKISTLQQRFKDEFTLTLRVYDGRSFADEDATIGQIRKKRGATSIDIRRNTKLGNLEERFMEDFGIKAQIAGSDDSYLCNNDLTLAAALEEDERKLGREAARAERAVDTVSDEGDAASMDDGGDDENGEWKKIDVPTVGRLAKLISSAIGDKKTDLKLIWDIKKIDSNIWDEWGEKIVSLEESKSEHLNSSISDLLEDLEIGDFWQLVVLSGKIDDVRFFLPALDFEEQFGLRSIDISEANNNILEFISEHGIGGKYDEKKSNLLVGRFNDIIIVLLENAIAEGDDEQLNNILSFAFDLRNADEVSGGSKDLADVAKYTIDFNYIDEIVEGVIFLICQKYQLNEVELRDDEGGLSVPIVVSHLESFM